MALTPSRMAELGTPAPDFLLMDAVSGRTLGREAVKGEKGLLVMFLCRHCPFVKHVQEELGQIGREYEGKGVGFVAISSNDVVGYPEDGPEGMKAQAAEQGFVFPYLYDETQDVARAYGAMCTPDFFLYDALLRLVYRGQLDDSRPSNGRPVTGHDLRKALNAVLDGMPVAEDQRASIGCNIKWKPGYEPA